MSGPEGCDGLTNWFVFLATTNENQTQQINFIIFYFRSDNKIFWSQQRMFWHVGYDDVTSRFVLNNNVDICFGFWHVGFLSTGNLIFIHYVLIKKKMCVNTSKHMKIYAFIRPG